MPFNASPLKPISALNAIIKKEVPKAFFTGSLKKISAMV
jgi:hypothetical protein